MKWIVPLVVLLSLPGWSLPRSLAALAMSSAWWGQRQIDRCYDARVEHERFLDQRHRVP